MLQCQRKYGIMGKPYLLEASEILWAVYVYSLVIQQFIPVSTTK